MADRWPASMSRSEAAEYLGMSIGLFEKVVRENEIPSFQWTERGDRFFHKVDLDSAVERRKSLPFRGRAA